MERDALIREISSLVESIATNLPVRLWIQQKCELGCLLLMTKEFFLDDDYLALVRECGLTLQEARDYISSMLRRQCHRWKL